MLLIQLYTAKFNFTVQGTFDNLNEYYSTKTKLPVMTTPWSTLVASGNFVNVTANNANPFEVGSQFFFVVVGAASGILILLLIVLILCVTAGCMATKKSDTITTTPVQLQNYGGERAEHQLQSQIQSMCICR